MNTGPTLTLAFTVFRPETAPFASRHMTGHSLVVLEEPRTPGFEEMLAGELAVDEYLMLTDFEFPEYAKTQCQALQSLHSIGTSILQLHPWMDELVGIHEFFAAGNGPADIPKTDYRGSCTKGSGNGARSFWPSTPPPGKKILTASSAP